jgi:hypothetical protein
MRRTLVPLATAALLAGAWIACESSAPRGGASAATPAADAAAANDATATASTPAPSVPPADSTAMAPGNVPTSPDQVPRVSPGDAAAAVAAGTAVIVDVRDTASWDNGHVKGALHVPLAQLEIHIASGDLPKDKRLIAYCS